MTKNQVSAILKELGYAANTPLPLKEVAYLVTDADEALYPNHMINRFIFDDENELLVTYGGHYDATGTNFILNPHPECVVDYELLIGFVLTSKATPAFGYEIGRR